MALPKTNGRKRPETTTHDIDIRTYQACLANAPRWMTIGLEHLQAAEVLWREIIPVLAATMASPESEWQRLGLFRPFLMLCGLGLENLLKALLVQREFKRNNGSAEVGDPAVLPRNLDGHNLVSLAERAGFMCADSERALLTRLSECIQWSGRYPVPKKAGPFPQWAVGTSEMADVEALATRVQDHYRRVGFPRQKPPTDLVKVFGPSLSSRPVKGR